MDLLLYLVISVGLALADEASDRTDEVRLPPTFISEPRDVVYREGTVDVPLHCSAKGTPTPTYNWTFNGAPLGESPGDGTLHIRSCTSRDEGFYQCRASNQYGTALSRAAFLQMAVLKPHTDAGVESLIGEEGRGKRIPCDRTIQTSVPAATYTWRLAQDKHDATPNSVRMSKRVVMDRNGNLYITNVVLEDHRGGQMYKCSARNAETDNEKGGSYTILTVRPAGSDLGRDLELMFSTASPLKVLVGEEAIMQCIFSGSPTPSVEWRPLRQWATPVQGNTMLTIKNVQPKHAGNYTCTATNDHQTSKPVVISLDVEAKPVFDPSKQGDQNVTVGDEVTFHCKTEAIPAATPEWFVNGKKLQRDNPRRRLSDDGTALTILSTCKYCHGEKTDLSVIQCNASNHHGYAFMSAYLNVLSPLIIEKSPEDVVLEAQNETVDFECVASTDPSTPLSLIWQRNGAGMDTNDPRVNITDSNTRLTLDLRELPLDKVERDYGGQYKCIASNTISSKEASSRLTIQYPVTTAKVTINTGDTGGIWWIPVVVVFVLLLLILLMFGLLYRQRNILISYHVDKTERRLGHFPEPELFSSGFKEYRRPEERVPLQGSRLSLGGTVDFDMFNTDDDDDEAWFNEYDDLSAGRFNEDGSFIGQYENNGSNRRKASVSSN